MRRHLFFVLLVLCSACGSGSSTATTAAVDDGSVLFAALRPVADEFNEERIRSGQLVLVDNEANPLNSGNPDYPLFVVHIDAYLQRNGEVGYHALFGNSREEANGLLSPQCGQRWGSLQPETDGTYTFAENGSLDTDVAFDSKSVECGAAPPPHPAEQLFAFRPITVNAAPDGDALLDLDTDDAGPYRFDVRPVAVSPPSPVTAAPPTTVEPTQVRPVTFDDFEANSDGISLSLLLNACGVPEENLDIYIVETGETITVEISETFSPPTTNALGEAEVIPDCQDALRIELEAPFVGQPVIDATTGEQAASG